LNETSGAGSPRDKVESQRTESQLRGRSLVLIDGGCEFALGVERIVFSSQTYGYPILWAQYLPSMPHS
jgi:hypothetical protein